MPAHLTLFQHLPPSIDTELRRQLAAETRGVPAPAARVAGIMGLDRGTAFRIESPRLEEIRGRLADHFHGLLIPQDQAGWRPHVTIQNKVEPGAARALRRALEQGFRPRPIVITGLAAWHYRGGLWDPLSRHAFD